METHKIVVTGSSTKPQDLNLVPIATQASSALPKSSPKANLIDFSLLSHVPHIKHLDLL